MTKKGQMNLKEMSFMIVALAIFFTLVLLFYLSISLRGLDKDVITGKRESSILLVAKLAGSPEFQCPTGNSLCVDVEKLLALKNHPEYLRFWGPDVAGLRVDKTYPFINSTIECTVANYETCNRITLLNPTVSNIIEDSSYVSLCRREFKNGYGYYQCDIGRIVVSTPRET